MITQSNPVEQAASFCGIFSMDHIIAEIKPVPQPQPEPVSKPKRGRPLKRDRDYYLTIWKTFCSMEKWYLETHGHEHRSVPELIEVYYTDLFQKHGLRVMRVNSPEFRGRMRTLENEISKAKKHQFPRH
ncbi:hypothetical protein [Rhodoferax sp. GW822-FHT02A01]|uniref:hypothetical protein n=1 Tax=Rhodoferax sp. GW822-FHT02A01 TaxID=3141537 RepID=UPI00315D123E